MGDSGGGAMFIGTKGTLICSTYARNPYIIGREHEPPNVAQEFRRVTTSHEMDWVRLAKKIPRIVCKPKFTFRILRASKRGSCDG